jgi:hypothetical protein
LRIRYSYQDKVRVGEMGFVEMTAGTLHDKFKRVFKEGSDGLIVRHQPDAGG